MNLPCIGESDAVIIGSSIAAMLKAASVSLHETVTLITSDTCLYAEMNVSGDWRLPRGLSRKEQTLFFPDDLREENGLFHPDRLKRHGEDVLKARGISLLYGCQVLGVHGDAVIFAHLSGLYAISCREAWDGRRSFLPDRPAYCLHTMRDGVHEALLAPDPYPGADADSQYSRYRAALSRLPSGSTLARGGMADTELDGIRVLSRRLPHADRLPLGPHDPIRENPMQKASPVFSGLTGLDAQEEGPYDLIVAGGGTSGAPAAIFGARAGLKVLLLEMNDRLGGTATVGGVSTYWFGLREGATAKIDEEVSALCRQLNLPRKACLWNENDSFPPDLKAHALLKMCLEGGTSVHLGCIVCGVGKTGNRVSSVYWVQGGKLFFSRATMILDCTGDGSLCVFAGADNTYGSKKDGMTYWASLAQYTAPDEYRNNFTTMVRMDDPRDYTRFLLSARRQGGDLYDHGQYLAMRESRHIRCMETVTLNDLLIPQPGRQPLYDCFSNLDPKGRVTAEIAYFGLLCPNRRVSVPRGAVIPVDDRGAPLEGLLVGGKAIGSTHDAFPLLRMQPDLQRQGLALAALAFCCIRQDCSARKAEDVEDTILKMGGDLPRNVAYVPAMPLPQVVEGLTGQEPWEWLDTPIRIWDDEVSPLIQILLAPSQEALPPLRRALDAAVSPAQRLTLSRLLLWHGDDAGAPTVIREIRRMLEETDGLPRRSASVRYGELLPDHGLMPECVYLLNSLSRARRTEVASLFSQVLSRLEKGSRDWQDLRAGIYCYLESLAYTAKARKDPAFLPLLEQALALPEFSGACPEDQMAERLDMLKITLLDALNALGSPRGKSGLQSFLRDSRLSFRVAAQKLLDD